MLLGVDIGGSGIKGAPVDPSQGQLAAARLRLPTPQPATPAAVAATVAELAAHFSWQGPIGCGLPAVVRHGIARTAANIDPEWIGTDAGALLSAASGCPVTVINDADAAGLAEMCFGAGRDQSGTVLLITVGTGLGTALFRDGRLLPNSELGHLLIRGRVAERYASAAVKKDQGLSYRKWAKRFERYLQRLEELLSPDLFIIGGGVSKQFERFAPYLQVDTPILPAQLRNDAGIVGAALAALDIENL
ncbi:MAG: ROK family protein [Desulfuromonadales bacterium]|nr:ROK family protein [Desulfuromonadales bacterium]